jgi:anti-sigma regulatory factor (Ser/Thr protein kinase)
MLGCRGHWVKPIGSAGALIGLARSRGRDIESYVGTTAGPFAPVRRDPHDRRARVGGSNVSAHSDDAVSLSLDGGPEAAGHARRALSRLRGDIPQPVMETMRLLVTELIANSVKHAGSDAVALKVVVGNAAVLVEVRDEGPGFEPHDRTTGQDETSGWGLYLVDRLADRWGVAHDESATRVWFELKR